MILIGIGNKARNGKDTAARAIVTHACGNSTAALIMAWADALYKEVNEFLGAGLSFGLSVQEVFENGFMEGGEQYDLPQWVQPTQKAEISLRAPFGKHSKLLQWWGTEYRRTQDANYWVKKGVESIRNFQHYNPNGVVVVPDTRFLNEAQAIKEMGGYTMRVARMNDDGTLFIDPSRDPEHVSETELDSYNWDFEIVSKSAALTERLAIATYEHIRQK